MTIPGKKKRNRYQENKIKVLVAKIRKSWPIMAFFASLCLILLLSAGMSRLYYALQDAPWLKIEEIEITGLKKLERTRVLDSMGVNRGECILNLRMGPIAERVKALPMVKSAAVRLDLPGRIVVEIVEREPYALMKCGDSFFVDEKGVLFAPAQPESNKNLPYITGLCGAKAAEGDTMPAHQMAPVKELVSALNDARNWLPASSLRECQWGMGGFTVVLGERAVPVELGHEGYARKISRLKKVIATLDERKWTELVTRIDLDYTGRAYLGGNFTVPKPAAGQAKPSS